MSISPVIDYKKKMGKYTLSFFLMGALCLIISGLSGRYGLPVGIMIIPIIGFIFFTFASAITSGFYLNGRRYVNMINALGPDVIRAKVVKGTLECTSQTYGEFYADYIVQGKYGINNYYRLWITTDKSFPVPDFFENDGPWEIGFKKENGLIKQFTINVKNRENVKIELSEAISIERIKGIKSIYEICLLIEKGENRILAKFAELWPHDETQDLISSLGLLELIEEKL